MFNESKVRESSGAQDVNLKHFIAVVQCFTNKNTSLSAACCQLSSWCRSLIDLFVHFIVNHKVYFSVSLFGGSQSRQKKKKEL